MMVCIPLLRVCNKWGVKKSAPSYITEIWFVK
jgi:hypothetical protein